MPTVLTVAARPRGRGCLVIFDDARQLLLREETVARYRICAGLDISDERIGDLEQEDERSRIRDSVWKLLSYRARTRAELRQRLLRQGNQATLVEAELERLTSLGHLDDDAFARALVSARQRGPAARGSVALRAELRHRGITSDVVDASMSGADDATAIRQAATKRAQSLRELPRPDFQRRLFAFLLRRGFDYELARSAVDLAWNEVHASDAGEAE